MSKTDTTTLETYYLSDAHIAALEKLGWKFLSNGPNEWEWMKFDPKTGYRVNRQGDRAWKDAVRYVKRNR